MPAYSTLKTFIDALNTGRTHITKSFDDFFSPTGNVTGHARWEAFLNGNWSSGPPPWLASVLTDPPPTGIGLTVPERDHVLKWPGPELERARDAAVRAVSGSGVVPAKAPKFFWELSNARTPQTLERVSSAGVPEIVFQSPRFAVRRTGPDQVEVHDV
jgi:hypothetical protein